MTTDRSSSRTRQVAGVALCILGGAATFLAATSPIAWGMVLGSGVELGRSAGAHWLMNLSEAAVAVGALVGGHLLDRGRMSVVAVLGILALLVGAAIGWRGHDSATAVLLGLGGLASLGAGSLMALAVVTPLRTAPVLPGLVVGATYGLGLVAVELTWGSGSMMALSRGARWVVGQVLWIGPLAGLVGAGLLVIARRLAPPRGDGSPRLPLLGPRAASRSVVATEKAGYWVLVALALMASFVGLMAQRAGAALSMIGVPANSFVSGVLVGFTFAAARASGAALGGVMHDLLGPRLTVSLSALALAITQLVLSRFVGFENPWHALIGAVGVACGLGLAVAPAAVLFLFGPDRLGLHFGYLVLATAFGSVMVLPLRPSVEAHPQGALLLSAALCLALAVIALRLRPPADGTAEVG